MDIGLMLSLMARYFFIYLKVRGTNSFPPPLTAEEEHECFVKMAQGDQAARAKLIEHNLRLVAHIVRKYYSSAKVQEDLVSIGTVGLIKAIDSYKYERAKAINGKAIKYVTERIDNVDEVVGRAGAINIKGDELIVLSSFDIEFRCKIEDLSANDLMSLDGVVLSGHDLEHDGRFRTIIAYYSYYR